MHYKHGAYWYVIQNKWNRLGDDYASAMLAYSAWVAPSGGMAKLIDDTFRHLEDRVKRDDLSPRTLIQYKLVRERIDTAFADFSPAQVKMSHITTFLDFHFDGMAATGNTALTVLRTIFGKGVRWGLCEYNPAKTVDRFAENKRTRYLTDKEFLLIRTMAKPQLRLIMDMCYLTAQRIGDVLHIKQADITDDGVQFQQQKGKKRLIVESSPELDDLVREARALSKIAGVYLFSRSASYPMNYSTIKKQWRTACEGARVDDARLHDLRAKAITDADAEGLDAQKLAGHANKAMTERYLRLMRTDRVQSPGKVRQLRKQG